MTAIRLDRPFTPQPSPPGADQARRAFFGQALERAQAPAKEATALPEPAAQAARAKAGERYESFITALGRRLAKGPTLRQEVPEDVRESEE